jgi:hypothetical protein
MMDMVTLSASPAVAVRDERTIPVKERTDLADQLVRPCVVQAENVVSGRKKNLIRLRLLARSGKPSNEPYATRYRRNDGTRPSRATWFRVNTLENDDSPIVEPIEIGTVAEWARRDDARTALTTRTGKADVLRRAWHCLP